MGGQQDRRTQTKSVALRVCAGALQNVDADTLRRALDAIAAEGGKIPLSGASLQAALLGMRPGAGAAQGCRWRRDPG